MRTISAVAAVAAVLLSAPVLAAPPMLAAGDCGSLASTQAIITRMGGVVLTPLEPSLAADFRAADLPVADDVLGAPMPNGELAVVYVRDGRACGVRIASPALLFALAMLRSRGESPAGPSF
jgi:hypothetical protein